MIPCQIARVSNFPKPTLDLNYAGAGALGGAETFTRASAGTYLDSAGLIALASTNVPRFDYGAGLKVEEQRTNLFLNSLIDGTNLSTQDVTVSATAYTLKFHGSGSITLSGVHSATLNGGGDYPASAELTLTPSAGTLTCTVSGDVKFAQIEAGSFATSFIPTAGATATRAADVVSSTGNDFLSWFNPIEGTFVVEGDALAAGTRAYWEVNASGGPGSNSMYSAVTNRAAYVTASSSTQADLSPNGAAAAGVVYKQAMAYRLNDFAACFQGGAVSKDISGVIPVVNQFKLGRSDAASNYLNGRIRRLRYYRRRLSDAELQALTR